MSLALCASPSATAPISSPRMLSAPKPEFNVTRGEELWHQPNGVLTHSSTWPAPRTRFMARHACCGSTTPAVCVVAVEPAESAVRLGQAQGAHNRMKLTTILNWLRSAKVWAGVWPVKLLIGSGTFPQVCPRCLGGY